MTEEKGLSPEVADNIGEYVKHKGLSFLFAGALNIYDPYVRRPISSRFI